MSETCPKCGRVLLRYATKASLRTGKAVDVCASPGGPVCKIKQLESQLAAATRRAEVAEETIRLALDCAGMPSPECDACAADLDPNDNPPCFECCMAIAYALAEADAELEVGDV